MNVLGSSFVEHLRTTSPHSLPGRTDGSAGPATGGTRGAAAGTAADRLGVPHGTTIVALAYTGGVLIAGDRRATSGNQIAQHDLRKVLVVDDTTAVGFAGSVGVALQMLRLYAVELEQYEKIEGTPISFRGKANRLSALVAGNLGAAMQGFVAMPLLVTLDPDEQDPARVGRIVSFDVTGSTEHVAAHYDAIGSGSVFAASALKKLHRRDADEATALRNAVEALWDAADDDAATGGPESVRGILPVVVTIDAARGTREVPDVELAPVVADVVAGRRAGYADPAVSGR